MFLRSNRSSNSSSRNNSSNSNRNTNTSRPSEDNSSSNASTSSTPGTFKNSQDAHKYADEEINRLAKENKKGYEYTLGRNNKGEVTVNIKPKK